ncbi:MAG TPA: choline/ethanolamine kinase family protein [Dongiaceae bacterium]|nr:choline/ethanolamine kinase family protein [Dongiaceae bacterium]
MTLPTELVTALQTIPALARWSPDQWQIEQLGGVTNRNYRLRPAAALPARADLQTGRAGDAAADFVLRLPGLGTSSYLNRPAGIHNNLQAASIGIAPDFIYADAERGWQLTRFLSGCRPLAAADLQDAAIRQGIGRLLGRLQREAGVFQHELRPFTIADRYLDLAPQADLVSLRHRARGVEREIEGAAIPLVPAHIDPNPANFLLAEDGSLYLIDWEFSAMADPCWDLAAIALEGAYTLDATAALLQAAGHPADATMLHRIELFRCALCLVASSWAYVEIAAGNSSGDLRRFAAQRQASFGQYLDRLGSD